MKKPIAVLAVLAGMVSALLFLPVSPASAYDGTTKITAPDGTLVEGSCTTIPISYTVENVTDEPGKAAARYYWAWIRMSDAAGRVLDTKVYGQTNGSDIDATYDFDCADRLFRKGQWHLELIVQYYIASNYTGFAASLGNQYDFSMTGTNETIPGYWKYETKTISRTGSQGTKSRSGHCTTQSSVYTTGDVFLDCWNGTYARAIYNFPVPAGAYSIVKSSSTKVYCCDRGTVTRVWSRPSTYTIRFTAKVTGWRALAVNRVKVTYTTKKWIPPREA